MLYFSCGSNADIDTVKASILKDEVSYCTQCSGLVKPDIVFFGENLPIRFFTLQAQYIYYNSKLLVPIYALLIQFQPVYVPFGFR